MVLFKQRPGADRKLGVSRSVIRDRYGPQGEWGVGGKAPRRHVYAKVTPKVRDGFVCRADRSPIYGGGAAVYG